MLTFIQNSRQNTVDTPLSQEELLVKILSHANKPYLNKFIETIKSLNSPDLESAPATDSLTFSPKIAKELTGFFDKISENLDALFYKKCQSDNFLSKFYKDIESASTRLESGRDLKPELRLELQPSAYSGFDDKLSKQNFANILFVIAIANYASNKSQGEIEESRFMDVLELMDKQKIKQEEEILRMPKSKAVMPHPNAFSAATLFLNLLLAAIQVSSFIIIRNKDELALNFAKDTRDNILRINKKFPQFIPSELAKYNVTAPEITEMTKRHEEKLIMQGLGIGESLSRSFLDLSVCKMKKPNTNFLLFATSLIFASESMAEIISNKNLVKTFSTYDEPTSVDNRLLVDGIRLALFVASRFDRRFGIDQIADRMIGGFSSLGTGLVNCVKSLFKSREGQDLESGPLLETRGDISPDQIKALAGEFSKFLTNSNEITISNSPRALSSLAVTSNQQRQ